MQSRCWVLTLSSLREVAQHGHNYSSRQAARSHSGVKLSTGPCWTPLPATSCVLMLLGQRRGICKPVLKNCLAYTPPRPTLHVGPQPESCPPHSCSPILCRFTLGSESHQGRPQTSSNSVPSTQQQDHGQCPPIPCMSPACQT